MSYSLIFDGDCGLCHHAVRFVLKHDTLERFIFISNLSEEGKELVEKHQLEKISMYTLVVLDERENLYLRGKAIRFITQQLPKYQVFGQLFQYFPLFILNFGYRIVSHYRRRLGLKTCLIPSAKQNPRIFL